MKNFLYIVGAIFILFIIGSGAWCAMNDQCSAGTSDAWSRHVEQSEADAAQTDDPAAAYLIYAVIGFIVLIVGSEVVGSAIDGGRGDIVIFAVIMLAVLGVVGMYIYGDKIGDGTGDTQIVVVVQPIGADAETDLAYSGVNQGNARANVFNMSAVAILILVLVIAAFFALGAALALGHGGV